MRLFYCFPMFLACIFVLIGCRPTPVDVAEDANETKVTIVSGQAVSEQDKQSMLAAKDALFEQLSGALMNAMTSGGPAAAIQVCQQKAPQLAAEVSQQHGLKIGRTGVRLRNEANTAPDWAEALTAKKVDTPQFVMLSSGNAAALLPIKLQVQCTICHGPEDQIIPEVKTELAKYYPRDRATGFQEGELRGWFWVEKPSSL